MEWRCLTEEELAELCDTALLQDFPAAELRPKAATLKMLRRGVYRPWGVFVSESDMPGCPPMERLAAYLLIACPLAEGPVLLDYFAVRPDFRESGVGAELLSELALREGRDILIEAETPETAPDTPLARRRLGFYHRCGALPTPWWDRVFQGRFDVLVLPAPGTKRPGVLSPSALTAIYHALAPGEEYVKSFDYGAKERSD